MSELPVIRSAAEARDVDPESRVLIEVSGASAATMLWLEKMLTDPDDSEPGRVVKKLMAATSRPAE
ncbi:hypothetical protein [Paractinoplanes brasiliensis]|uniref:Uncharacterized protein n=1 Tax=Paractinoplanes brasiliensis TaxID=52695 RepID=A0A4R6JMI7_9ACTN|nr:hypothetical protein [Actinoplanes brasiliensis]TDO36942.1 hypothetical protein C8E87_0532 [Actinoplanes brasiliensis]GID30464.1 hypothetical protein Abr02nite_54470 [Actinoplanes brasiliensis]